jgi:hypothetical protein
MRDGTMFLASSHEAEDFVKNSWRSWFPTFQTEFKRRYGREMWRFTFKAKAAQQLLQEERARDEQELLLGTVATSSRQTQRQLDAEIFARIQYMKEKHPTAFPEVLSREFLNKLYYIDKLVSDALYAVELRGEDPDNLVGCDFTKMSDNKKFIDRSFELVGITIRQLENLAKPDLSVGTRASMAGSH